MQVSHERSKSITDKISAGILTEKPGWVRLSLHPTMTDAEARYVVDAITQLAAHHGEWAKDYRYCERRNEFSHVHETGVLATTVNAWFDQQTFT